MKMLKDVYRKWCDDMDALTMKRPTKTQIGGNHYTKMAIQPIEFSMLNGLDPLQHTIIKYVVREKNDWEEDLNKAKHCIDLLIEFRKSRMAPDPFKDNPLAMHEGM